MPFLTVPRVQCAVVHIVRTYIGTVQMRIRFCHVYLNKIYAYMYELVLEIVVVLRHTL
jgi:hypothetical protein